MVVRSTIGAVLFRLPYSDRIPDGVRSILEEHPAKEAPEEPSEEQEAAPKTEASPTLLGSAVMPDLEEDDTLRGTESEALKDEMVQQYLVEQNAKFNKLINRNLHEVLQQQNQFEEEVGWRRLALELALARNPTEVKLRVSLLVSKASRTAYSYVPFTREKHPLSTRVELVVAKEQTLALLDPLDYDEKVALLRQLLVDLGAKGDDELARLSKELNMQNNRAMIDKVELITLLWVRLGFIGLKLVIPATKLLYIKFKNNDMVVFNNRNLNKLLGVAIRLMESLEEKLHVYEPQSEEPENKDTTVMTRDELLRMLELRQQQEQESKHWVASILRFTSGQFTAKQRADLASDPRFAQYFTENMPGSFLSGNLSLGLEDEPPSMFEVAQKFASQMA